MVENATRELGLIETVLVRNGVACLLEEHIERLRRSARELMMPVPEGSRVRRAVEGVTEGSEHAVRIEWRAIEGQWSLAAVAFPVPPLTIDRRNGCHLISLPETFGRELPAWKTDQRDDCVRGLAYAAGEGGNEGLFVDGMGSALEGTVTNVFLVAGDELVLTPPADGAILPGVMRERTASLLRAAGIRVQEQRFPASQLYEQPSFVTSSLTLVAPVTRFNGRDAPQSPLVAALRRQLLQC